MAEPYQYESLTDNKQSIRVISIRRTKGDTIYCDLEHIDLVEDGHTCLSYMWGPASPTKTIYINDKPFEIRENLYDFLCRARKWRLRQLWIDAICINQEDIVERCHQVRIMSRVYSLAKCVIIWAGSLSRQMANMTMLAGSILLLRSSNLLEPFFSNVPFRLKSKLFFRLWGVQKLKEKCYSPLLESPYWTRLWVVQEVQLARRCKIATQAGLRSWTNFRRAIEFFSVYDSDPPDSKPRLRLFTASYYRDIDGDEFPNLIERHLDGRCEERHDHVYALLGLLKHIPENFPVDYDRSIAVLGLDVLEFFVARLVSVPAVALSLSLTTSVHTLCARCYTTLKPALDPDSDKIPDHLQNGTQLFWLTCPLEDIQRAINSMTTGTLCTLHELKSNALHLSSGFWIDDIVCQMCRQCLSAPQDCPADYDIAVRRYSDTTVSVSWVRDGRVRHRYGAYNRAFYKEYYPDLLTPSDYHDKTIGTIKKAVNSDVFDDEQHSEAHTTA